MGGQGSDMFEYFKILMLQGFVASRKHMGQDPAPGGDHADRWVVSWHSVWGLLKECCWNFGERCLKKKKKKKQEKKKWKNTIFFFFNVLQWKRGSEWCTIEVWQF